MKIKARGVLYIDTRDLGVKLLKNRFTRQELIALIRTIGKRAQTRIKELGKWYDEKSPKYMNRLNPLYERYRGYNVQTLGLSNAALYAKVKDAVNILNDRRSMKYTYNALYQKSYETFKRNNPRAREWSFEEWETYMKYFGAWEKAHEDQQYDSDQVLAYIKWASDRSMQLTPESLDLDEIDKWFLNSLEREKGTWISLKEDFELETTL